MATQPAFLKPTDERATSGLEHPAGRTVEPVRVRNPYQLRALPQEDVFFFCKKIDNSRLVREADPRAPKACWNAIGVAALAVAFFAGVLAPNLMNTLAGYQLEKLRAEERGLLDERHNLEFKEAELLNVNRLERLAKDRHLTLPAPGQLVHLNGTDSSVAMVQRQQ
jgi:hypothetical protein